MKQSFKNQKSFLYGVYQQQYLELIDGQVRLTIKISH